MRTGAHIISFIFHPLLLATYLVAILGFYFPAILSIAPQNFKVILAFVFCFTFILPVVNLVMFRQFGTISSYTLRERTDRLLPFVAIMIIYLVMTFLFFNKLPFSTNLNKFMVIVAALVVFSTFLTFFFKVSVHSVAMGGMIGILLPLNKAIDSQLLLWPTVIALTIAGLVMSSRLYLNTHTSTEVSVGFVSGFAISFAAMLVLF